MKHNTHTIHPHKCSNILQPHWQGCCWLRPLRGAGVEGLQCCWMGSSRTHTHTQLELPEETRTCSVHAFVFLNSWLHVCKRRRARGSDQRSCAEVSWRSSVRVCVYACKYGRVRTFFHMMGEKGPFLLLSCSRGEKAYGSRARARRLSASSAI